MVGGVLAKEPLLSNPNRYLPPRLPRLDDSPALAGASLPAIALRTANANGP